MVCGLATTRSARTRRRPWRSGRPWRDGALGQAFRSTSFAPRNRSSTAGAARVPPPATGALTDDRRSHDQLVTGAVDRDDVARLGGVLFDLLAQLDHEVVDAAGAGVAGHAP